MAWGPPQSVYTSQTPSVTAAMPTGTHGTNVVCAVAGRITGLRYRWPAENTADSSRTIRLWTTAGAALGSVAVPRGTSGTLAWMSATLTTPVDVTAGQTVRVSVDIPAGNMGSRLTNPVPPIVNGDLTIPGTADSPAWTTGTVGAFPSGTTSRHYFGDVVFEALLAAVGGRPKVYAGGTWTAYPAKVYAGGGYGAAQSAYTTQPIYDTSPRGVIAFGNDFQFAVAGRITGMKLNRSATDPSWPHKLSLWSSSTTKVADTTLTEAGSGWRSVLFGTPVPVTAGQIIRASLSIPESAGHDVHRTVEPASNIVNSDITMLKQGYYKTGITASDYPDTAYGYSFYVDVIFEAGTAAGWTEKPMKRHNGSAWVPIT